MGWATRNTMVLSNRMLTGRFCLQTYSNWSGLEQCTILHHLKAIGGSFPLQIDQKPELQNQIASVGAGGRSRLCNYRKTQNDWDRPDTENSSRIHWNLWNQLLEVMKPIFSFRYRIISTEFSRNCSISNWTSRRVPKKTKIIKVGADS